MARVRKNFVFSQNTGDNLKELVKMGIVKNETEAVDMSVEHFLTEKKMAKKFEGASS